MVEPAHHDRWTLSPRQFRGVATAAVCTLVVTVVSGAAVRLTGSGLGCSTWPDCTAHSVVAPLSFHAWVEFGNRLINAAVTVAAIGALVAAWRRRPYRRDLVWLSFGLVVGLVVEVVMGGIVVYEKLNPTLVSIHFLLGLAFLAWAVLLQHRSGLPDGGIERVPAAPAAVRGLATALLAALAVAATAGTVVTSTGPHGGAPDAPRYHFALGSVARLHGTLAEVFMALTVITLVVLARSDPAERVLRRAQWLLGAALLQGAVGYIQYFNGDPVGVVALHVAGASILVVAALHFYLGLWEHRAVTSSGPAAGAGAESGSEVQPAAVGAPGAGS